MHIGALIAQYSNKEKNIKSVINNDQLNRLKMLGKILLIFSLPFAVYDFYTTMQLAVTGGYKNVYSNVTYGLASIGEKIVPYFFISLLILIVAYRNEIKKSKFIYILTLIYSGIQIFFGARGLPILQVVCTIILWNTMIKKISVKKMIFMIIAIIPLSAVISLMKEMRTYPLSEWFSNFFVIFNNSLKNNAVLLAINEMGIAIYPTSASIILTPNNIPFRYGSTFLFAFGAIIPNLGSVVHWTKQYIDIANQVASYFNSPMGGSIVEEGFVNFGWCAPIFLAIVGFLIVKLDNYVIKNKEKKEWIYPLYMAASVQIIWTVRNTIAPLIIYFIRYIFLTYLLYKFLNLKKQKKVENYNDKEIKNFTTNKYIKNNVLYDKNKE